MSKSQKDKSLTKDKLIGMKVINADGKLVGTVKDVGFTVGKVGIFLNVEDEDGEIQDIPWENIQGAADFVVLKPPASRTTESIPVVQTAQPVQQVHQASHTQQPVCPTCRNPLSYIQQYQRWYCYSCKKYV
ncbi:MAG: PRC-barrel domain-containing protein [Candidatus Bathyarchaeota archaeon]|nr:PRC-barrel domain-containing protein [Candidatus Bathyarchaeota archaeon]